MLALAGFWQKTHIKKEDFPVVINKEDHDPKDGVDIPNIIGVYSICFSFLVTIPTCYFPLRQQLSMLLFGKEEFSKRANYIMTPIIVLSTFIIAYEFRDIAIIMSIIGGLTGVTIDYGIPTFCFVMLRPYPWHHFQNISRIIIFGLVCLCGYVGVGFAFYDAVIYF